MPRRGTKNGNVPRARRRWWQLTSSDLTAQQQARQLWVLAHELEHVGARVRQVARDMGPALPSSSIEAAGRKLERLGRRWLARSEGALNEAARADVGDRDWRDTHDRLAREDWAINLMASAAKEMELAADQLYDDAATGAQLRSAVEQLDNVYWHVHERDATRRWQRFDATGTDPTIRVDDPSIGTD